MADNMIQILDGLGSTGGGCAGCRGGVSGLGAPASGGTVWTPGLVLAAAALGAAWLLSKRQGERGRRFGSWVEYD